ncbi:MAG: cyclic nucleotide-binding domain-containing protein [Ghiorsea sp.]|nr:cyclic nucleotide-binding domain-containing protein [Ghiorsea sp.]
MSLEALKKQAKQALMASNYESALKLYTEAHKKDEKDLRVFTKVAEMREKTGASKGAVRAYTVIAKAYADDGFVVQAIAINKLILRLDPEQTEIKEKLRDLSTERGDDWAISTIAAYGGVSDIQASPSDKAKLSFERTPLLSGLSGKELDDFIESLELKEYPAGDVIYEANKISNALFLIGMGAIRLETKGMRGVQQVFSRLGEGDFFGELSFMNKEAHQNSAIAESDVSLLIIHRKVFDEWVKKHPSIHDTVEDFYRRRVLARILAITPVFEGIPQDARVPLAQKFGLSFFHDGDLIIKEGDVESTFYLVRSGKVRISTKDKKDPNKEILLGSLGEGSFFGEVSMLTSKPRTASAEAIGSVELLTLTRDKFDAIAKDFPTVRKVVEAYLKQRVMNTIKTLKDKT